MKRVLLLLPAVILIAAGCNQSNPQPTSVIPTASTTAKAPTPTPVPVVKTSAVNITALTPSTAAVGTTISISGSGFTPTGNQILFGDMSGRHHPDGSADNVIATVASPDGKKILFTVPATGPSGILCDAQNHCVGISAIKRLPGTYNVVVRNKNGISNVRVLTVK